MGCNPSGRQRGHLVEMPGCNPWGATHVGDNVDIWWKSWGATHGVQPKWATTWTFGGNAGVQPMGCNPCGRQRGHLVEILGCNPWGATQVGDNVDIWWKCRGATHGVQPMWATTWTFGGNPGVQPMGCNPSGRQRGHLVEMPGCTPWGATHVGDNVDIWWKSWGATHGVQPKWATTWTFGGNAGVHPM